MNYKRPILKNIINRLKEERRFIQVLIGPRQVGKTTLIQQALTQCDQPHLYASADEPSLKGLGWIEQQWNIARIKTKSQSNFILVLDEIQKLTDWSETVKKLWDEDTISHQPIKVVLLSSTPLLIQKGLTESLAGRFEVTPVMHWSYQEMHDAFDMTLDQYVYFGGYPGSASLINEESRWHSYISDSLIETTLSRDILLMNRVDKPALLRQLFELGAHYSGQILSYQKMLGQLQDAGNTTTLAHYLKLLSQAGMLAGLSKYSGKKVLKRASSPKLQTYNTALLSATNASNFKDTYDNKKLWGRYIESIVGMHLLNNTFASKIEILYWREGDYEVDFVITKGNSCIALEVKSSIKKGVLSGMDKFIKKYNPTKTYVIADNGLQLKDFLNLSIENLF